MRASATSLERTPNALVVAPPGQAVNGDETQARVGRVASPRGEQGRDLRLSRQRRERAEHEPLVLELADRAETGE